MAELLQRKARKLAGIGGRGHEWISVFNTGSTEEEWQLIEIRKIKAGMSFILFL